MRTPHSQWLRMSRPIFFFSSPANSFAHHFQLAHQSLSKDKIVLFRSLSLSLSMPAVSQNDFSLLLLRTCHHLISSRFGSDGEGARLRGRGWDDEEEEVQALFRAGVRTLQACKGLLSRFSNKYVLLVTRLSRSDSFFSALSLVGR